MLGARLSGPPQNAYPGKVTGTKWELYSWSTKPMYVVSQQLKISFTILISVMPFGPEQMTKIAASPTRRSSVIAVRISNYGSTHGPKSKVKVKPQGYSTTVKKQYSMERWYD
jgi:hypothetical protein